MHYNATLRCESCDKETRHVFRSGKWFCVKCEHASKLGEALSDIAKAGSQAVGGDERMNPNLLFSEEDVKNACHGFIGSPLKNQAKQVIGRGVKTRVQVGLSRDVTLLVTYKLNHRGIKELDGQKEVEIAVMRGIS